MSFSTSTSAFLKATLSMVGLTGGARMDPVGMRLLAAPRLAERKLPQSDSLKIGSGESLSHAPGRAVFGRRLPQQAAPVFDRDPHLHLTRDGIWELQMEQDQETAA